MNNLINEKYEEVKLRPAPKDGVFPEGFYVTTNLPTYVFFHNTWKEVDRAEMDCAIKVIDGRAELVAINDVKAGDLIVVGENGIKLKTSENDLIPSRFGFMTSKTSSEKPKTKIIKEIAREIKKIKAQEGKVLVVGGPAIIHTNARKELAALIKNGYVDVLFAGNALATHDIEAALYNTSLDSPLSEVGSKGIGHGLHLQAINKIRQAGSIAKAVDQGILNEGIMYEAVRNNLDYVLAGSIRDDGPLPEVITDSIEAQSAMRSKLEGVNLVLMLATMLHSIATGNLLSAEVKSVCVDINPATITKLADRGTAQTIGLVTDIELFLKKLNSYLS
ncbi:MAG: TIGR00300 family protein [Bacillota bacterium]